MMEPLDFNHMLWKYPDRRTHRPHGHLLGLESKGASPLPLFLRVFTPRVTSQDACCAVVLGDHVATSLEQLEALLTDVGALRAAGNSTQLFGFDHRWPHSGDTSAPQVIIGAIDETGSPA